MQQIKPGERRFQLFQINWVAQPCVAPSLPVARWWHRPRPGDTATLQPCWGTPDQPSPSSSGSSLLWKWKSLDTRSKV